MEPLRNWFDLTGQVALVTGASRGIGRALACALASAGAQVACLATKAANAEDTVAKIQKSGGEALALGGDVAVEADVAAAVDATLQAFSHLDILINNAGILLEKSFADISLSEWKRIQDVNVTGMFLCARLVLAEMVRAGRGGKLVNIGSTAGRIAPPRFVDYCTSKAAIDGLTRSLATEYARYEIRVNCIAPGYVATDLNRKPLADEKIKKAILSRIPLRRVAMPEELGPLAVLLCSRGGEYITGQTIYVDGGQVIS
jgi:NAD(P)-dependent dehydrogenase (short-subunit alcohol dehydrogenase family)